MNILLILAGVVWAYMSIWYVISLITKRSDVADVAWGMGFVLIAWLSYFWGSSNYLSIAINCLVTIWGTRLAWHIYLRNRNKVEDYRYQQWRNEWKNFYIRSYLQIFVLQGILMLIIAIPVIAVNSGMANFVNVGVGLMIWTVGFVFESVGDWQLKEFIKNKSNRGMVMDKGLWRYTRHPNYFGEVVMWWGIWVASLGNGSWWTIIGPITISYLIIFVSGIPLLENKMQKNKNYQEYMKRTSMFLPWPPKHES